MKREAENPEEYIAGLPEEFRDQFEQLRETIRVSLPAGFRETMSYGMIGYVVPHSLYPAGYHANPKLPLPFINIAAQKNHLALYHMGLYSDPELLEWFTAEYRSATGKLPDMGKSCIRFKKGAVLPLELIARLVVRITPEEWIRRYETMINKKQP